MKLEAEQDLADNYEDNQTASNTIQIKQDPIKEEPKIEEKVVTLNTSSSKQIAFKKRKIEGQQQRKRTDD